jgi:hypothetical protein
MYPSEAPEKRCGTCKWYRPLWSLGGRKGSCNHELPDLPIGIRYVEVQRYLVEHNSENCPTWEEADATHHPHPAE